jgi:hypothetical protein
VGISLRVPQDQFSEVRKGIGRIQQAVPLRLQEGFDRLRELFAHLLRDARKEMERVMVT